MKRPKVISAEAKRQAVGRVAAGEAASAVAAALKVDRRRVYEWQDQVRQGGLEALRGPGRPRKGSLEGPPLKSAILNEGAAARRRIAELERKIGEQQADLACLASRGLRSHPGDDRVARQSDDPTAVPPGRGEPVGLLPVLAQERTAGV